MIGTAQAAFKENLRINVGGVYLDSELKIPASATGVVLFAHGSGSSRHSPRNQYVARVIREAGVGTLLFDLLTNQEERFDASTGGLRFNIEFLANRLLAVTKWIAFQPATQHFRIGYFGASTGAAAALLAAAQVSNIVSAVVSRGGRPDLAGKALPRVKAPTLLIVGGQDDVVIGLNEEAYKQLTCEKELKIVPGASHLFEEPGTLEQVARLASDWFEEKLRPAVVAQTT